MAASSVGESEEDTLSELGFGGSSRSLSFSACRSSANFGPPRSRRNSCEDEEALKWAAIEKLPTFVRMRTAIVENMQGNKVHREQVDLRTLGQGKMRQELMRKLFNNSEQGQDEDNSKFLFKLRERIDRVGMALPTVEVRYENLNIGAQVHVGGRGLPSLFNAVVNAVEGCLGLVGLNVAKKKNITILHDVSGVIKPGRMTLLLGPPSSGKTTFLLALAGKLDSNLKVRGKVTYNGYGLDEFVPQKTSAYVSQHDLHMGQLTVRETLEYSAKFQDVGPQRYELLRELTRREKELGIYPEADVDFYMKASALKETASGVLTEYMLKILGLDICADTLIGDQMIRGISGGQKKRVTTGEMMVGPMKTLFMDEISTGLDSSTTFQIVKYLRDIAHKLEATLVISLLQPAPETYELFDDVILLSEGQVAYHGPRENILEFFESCGFRCPARKGIADFLQEVTSRKDQEQYWIGKRFYEFVPVREFAEAFRSSKDGRSMTEELKTPLDRSKSHEAALTFDRYNLTFMELLKINFDKEWLLIRRNAFIYVFKTVQIGFLAVIAFTVYNRTRMPRNNFQDAQVFSGAIFFGTINILFNGFYEMTLTIFRLPILYKQRDMLHFPPWSFTLASWILSIPISAVETFIWVSITYYTIGFAPAASRFFKQLLLFFWLHQMSSSFFHFIGAACRSLVLCSTAGSLAMLTIFTMGGFLISRGSLPVWWIWGYWASPLSYAQSGASVLEFLSPQWNQDGSSSDSLGVSYLKLVSLPQRSSWYWIAVVALIGYTIVFNVLFTLCITYLGPLDNHKQAIMSEEQRIEAHGNLTGEILSSATASRRSLPRSLTFTGTASKVTDLVARISGLSSATVDIAVDCDGDASRRTDLADFALASWPSNKSQSLSRRSLEVVLETVDGVPRKRGMMSLPFKPLSISFDDLQYYVDMPAQMKAQGAVEDRLQLLQGITGAFRPGVLTALVGVSGAGKTTLMDVLAGRKTGGYIEGDIRISGFPKNQATFARIAGYCEQNDIHSPQVTVCESLIYSAWLRLGQEVDNSTKWRFVQEVMELVELIPLQDALVGLPGVSGLSTEQRKRLTVAVELVANPSIIFMDEPTSGLDARAAAIVMRTVRNTVDTGRTVVCTIHQPSIDIFDAFDELLLLKRGGQVIYAGPLGRHADKVVDYFQAVPGVPKIKKGQNPAAWMLEVTTPELEQRLGVDFAEIYKKAPLFQRNKTMVQELRKLAEAPDAENLWFPTQYSQPFWSQLSSCLWKQHLNYWRSPDYNNVRTVFACLAALLYGSVYWQVGKKRSTQQDIVAIAEAIAGSVIFSGLINSQTVQPIVERERTVFYRERAAGMYSAAPYAMAQVLIELPYCMVQTVLYSVITYSMIGLEWSCAKFFWYFYFMFCTFAYFTYYGMMAVGITPNSQISQVVAAVWYQIWNLFSGYLIPPKRLPSWTIWYYWICPTAWTVYGVVVSQLGTVQSEVTVIVGSSDFRKQPISQFLEDFFGFRHSFLPAVAVMHLVFTMLFAFTFMLSIKHLNFQNR